MLVSPNFASQQRTLKPAVFLPTTFKEALVSDHLLHLVSLGQQLAPVALVAGVKPLLKKLGKWLCQTACLPASELIILDPPLTDVLLWLFSLNRGGSQGRTSVSGGSRMINSLAGRQAVWQSHFPSFFKSGLTPATSATGASCCPRLTR